MLRQLEGIEVQAIPEAAATPAHPRAAPGCLDKVFRALAYATLTL